MKKAGGKKMGKPMSLAMPSGTPDQNKVVSVDGATGVAEDMKRLDEALLQYANRDLTIAQFQFINAQGQMAVRKMAILGKGTYGDVYRMRLKSDRTPLAVKTLRKDKFYMTEEVRKACKTQEEVEEARKRIAKARSRLLIEIAVLQELTIETQGKHDHLLAYHATFFDAEHIYIVMELFTGVELFQYLAHKWAESKGRLPLLPLRDILIISSMLLEALQFIHNQGIIHRDVKLENVMVKPDRTERRFQLKLIDFGQAKYTRAKTKPRKLDGSVSPGPGATTPTGNGGRSPLNSPAISVTPGCGSMIYLPIEALSKIVDREEWLCTPRFATKLDIYACGMMVLILLRGPPHSIQDLALPVPNETQEEEKERHKRLLKEVQSSYLNDELDKVDEQFKPLASLAKEMLHINPNMRPSTDEALLRLRELAPFLADRRDNVQPLSVLALAASVACNVVYGAVASPAPEVAPPTALTLPAGLASMQLGVRGGPPTGGVPQQQQPQQQMQPPQQQGMQPGGVPVGGGPGISVLPFQPQGGGISMVGMQQPGQPQQQQQQPGLSHQPYGAFPQQGAVPQQQQQQQQRPVGMSMQQPFGVGQPPQQQQPQQPGFAGGPQPVRISAHAMQAPPQAYGMPPGQMQQAPVQQTGQWNPYDAAPLQQQQGFPPQMGGYAGGPPMMGGAPQQGQAFTTATWIACMRAHDEDAMRQDGA